MNKCKINEKGISTVVLTLILVIIILCGVIGVMVYDHKDKTASGDLTSNDNTSSQPTAGNSEVAVINSIINQGDYLGLTAHMSDNVKVVKEGTDAGGTNYSSTKAAATISDFYSKSNTSAGSGLPWDFTGDGNYKSSAAKSTGAVNEYIAQGHIAVSKNNWVLAYNLDDSQKISSFYMSPSVNLSK